MHAHAESKQTVREEEMEATTNAATTDNEREIDTRVTVREKRRGVSSLNCRPGASHATQGPHQERNQPAQARWSCRIEDGATGLSMNGTKPSADSITAHLPKERGEHVDPQLNAKDAQECHFDPVEGGEGVGARLRQHLRLDCRYNEVEEDCQCYQHLRRCQAQRHQDAVHSSIKQLSIKQH